jgi:hypothetical protein
MRRELHWILERRDCDGAWHAVGARPFIPLTPEGHRMLRPLHPVNHLLYQQLVGTPTDPGVMTPGLPADATATVRLLAAHYARGTDDWGHADGRRLLATDRVRLADAHDWVMAWLRRLDDALFANPLPAFTLNADGLIRLCPESAIEFAGRRRVAGTLLPWSGHPDAWRLITFFDS